MPPKPRPIVKSAAAAPIPVPPIPVHCVSASQLPQWIAKHAPDQKDWIAQLGFKAKEYTICALPNLSGPVAKGSDTQGKVQAFLCGLPEKLDLWSLSHLPTTLPAGRYEIRTLPKGADTTQLAIGAKLGAYQFSAFKHTAKQNAVEIIWPKGTDLARTEYVSGAMIMGRDLINLPTNKMGPSELQKAVETVAQRHGADCSTIVGEALLQENYPTIHAVGRASTEAPRLMDMRWGSAKHPKVTLVGKGVCFDTGGLNIKTGGGMKLMKKDMGGAAIVLAVAEMVMQARLPIRLRVLIPAVENSIAGNAMRPSDIIRTRKGTSVEVNDTDAEGRLILCDALAEADSESPALIIDCSTLTGAARIAVGAELAAYFTDDDQLAADIQRHSGLQCDPAWRLPLWEPYRDHLHSHAADMSNISDSSYGGAIVAALFLKHFVEKAKSWVHFDMMAWNVGRKPGRPVGGEAMAARTIFSLLNERYGTKAAR